MDSRYYNKMKRRKKAEYAYTDGTGESEYDKGLYYLSRMIHELLSAYYYSQQNNLRFLPEEDYEWNWQNEEPRFMNKVIDFFVEVTLSKLIERKKSTWNFHQLLKEVKKSNWSDYKKIEEKISVFEKRLKFIKDNRNERYAHTSKKNQPNVLHRMIGNHKESIIISMDILDMFVDGIIPHKITIGESKEINLRTIVDPSMSNNIELDSL